MTRMIAAAAAAVSLALLGGALVATGTPALADQPGNSAWGADASGPQTLGPVALATPDFTFNVAFHADLAGLLATGFVHNDVVPPGAWTWAASSRIAPDIVLTLPNQARLTVTNGMESRCRPDGRGGTEGSVGVYGGTITELGYHPTWLPEHPTRNWMIILPGRAGTITLNYQVTRGGSTTYTAIHAVLGAQTVNLAVAKCNSLTG